MNGQVDLNNKFMHLRPVKQAQIGKGIVARATALLMLIRPRI